MRNLTIIPLFPTVNLSSSTTGHAANRVGRGPRGTDRLLGCSFLRNANSYGWYLCNWDSKSGLNLAAMEWGKKKKKRFY